MLRHEVRKGRDILKGENEDPNDTNSQSQDNDKNLINDLQAQKKLNLLLTFACRVGLYLTNQNLQYIRSIYLYRRVISHLLGSKLVHLSIYALYIGRKGRLIWQLRIGLSMVCLVYYVSYWD